MEIQKCNPLISECYNDSFINEYINAEGEFQIKLVMVNYQLDPLNSEPIIEYIYSESFNFIPGLFRLSTRIYLSEENYFEDFSIFPTKRQYE